MARGRCPSVLSTLFFCFLVLYPQPAAALQVNSQLSSLLRPMGKPYNELVVDTEMDYLSPKFFQFLVFMFVSLVTLFAVKFVGVVSKPYQPEYEVEKLYRKFHSFSTFWAAVSKQPSPAKERWVGTLCLAGGSVDPVLDLPQVDFQSTAGRPPPPNNNTFAGIAAELASGAGASPANPTALLQVGLTMRPGQAALKERASQCWEKLLEKVMHVRDLRSWRMMVKRSLRTLAVLMCVTGIVNLVFGYNMITQQNPECKETALNTDTTWLRHRTDCMNDHNGFYVCKVFCLVQPYADQQMQGFYWCFTDKSTGFATWVPTVECPSQ